MRYVPPPYLADRPHRVSVPDPPPMYAGLVPVWDPRTDPRLPGLRPHLAWVRPDDPRALAADS